MRQYGIVNTSFHAILWMVHFISVFPFLNDLDCKMSEGFMSNSGFACNYLES